MSQYHTPGPWSVSNGTIIDFIRAPNDVVIGTADPPRDGAHDERKANARLIATSPDLLETAEWFVNLDWNDGRDINEIIEEAEERFQTVIAKAKGQETKGHTPRQWTYSRASSGPEPAWEVRGPDENIGGYANEADAKLIAEAPETAEQRDLLLAALEAMVRSFERSEQGMHTDERRACKLARAALAKAKGQEA